MKTVTIRRGEFILQVYGPDGKFRRAYKAPNAKTLVGRNHELDSTLSGGTQITSWYFGAIGNTSFTTGLADSDTMSSHAGWTESTAYSEGTRQQWVDGGAASSSITNPNGAAITVNANVTLKGAFITSDSTKGGTTGTLFATGLFDGGDAVIASGEVIRLFWTDTLANG